MPHDSIQLREALRERLRSRLRVDASGPHASTVAALLEDWGAEVLAVLEDSTGRARTPLLVLVSDYASVLELPSDVLLARLFPPRLTKVELGAESTTVEVLSLDRLERECSGHAWDFEAVGRLVRPFRLVHAHSPLVEERLTDCWVGAWRLVTRIAIDQSEKRFTLGEIARRVISLACGNTSSDVRLRDASLYDAAPEEIGGDVLGCLRYWAGRTDDLEERDESWSLRMNRQRRFQRAAYSWVFLSVARVRRFARSPGVARRLRGWQRRLGLLPVGEEG